MAVNRPHSDAADASHTDDADAADADSPPARASASSCTIEMYKLSDVRFLCQFWPFGFCVKCLFLECPEVCKMCIYGLKSMRCKMSSSTIKSKPALSASTGSTLRAQTAPRAPRRSRPVSSLPPGAHARS